MALPMSTMTVPVFVHGLKILATLLEKGESHASLTDTNPQELLDGRLAEDMYPLVTQVQRACDACKFAVQRIGDVEAPCFADEETSFEQLYERISGTIAYLESINPSLIDAGESREIVLPWGPRFVGASYLLIYALPNFYFHLVTAYDILRHKGVNVGKLDYLGPFKGHSGN